MNFSLKSFSQPILHPFHHPGLRKLGEQLFHFINSRDFKKYLWLTLAAHLTAAGAYLLFSRISIGNDVLAALAGTSALLYLGLMVYSPSPAMMLMNLLIVPVIFTLAYASLGGHTSFLIAAFLAHGIVAAAQMLNRGMGFKRLIYCWANFNLIIMYLL